MKPHWVLVKTQTLVLAYAYQQMVECRLFFLSKVKHGDTKEGRKGP